MTNELDAQRMKNLAGLLERVSSSQRAAAVAGREFHKAIAAALKAGIPPADVAKAASLSRARVYQIAKQERRLS